MGQMMTRNDHILSKIRIKSIMNHDNDPNPSLILENGELAYCIVKQMSK